MRFLCVGHTGSGKTSFINILLRRNVTNVVGYSDTDNVIKIDVKRNSKVYELYDTPGLGDTGKNDRKKLSDSEIIAKIKVVKNINCVLFFIGINDKVDNNFAYRISEIAHLYDIPFTHFTIVITMLDIKKISDRINILNDFKKIIYSKFGLINIIYSGDFDVENNSKEQIWFDEFNKNIDNFFSLIDNMPNVNPIHDYVSTEDIDNARIKFLKKYFESNKEMNKKIN